MGAKDGTRRGRAAGGRVLQVTYRLETSAMRARLVKLLHVELPVPADRADDEVIGARSDPEARVSASHVRVRGDLQPRAAARRVDEHLEGRTGLVRTEEPVDPPMVA